MAAHRTVIGRATRLRGRVTGDGDLDVQGFVDGEISVGGDVTIDTQGMVGGGVSARRLVVRGAIKGDLVGLEAVSIEDGARVVGNVRAPRVAIATGALVRGFVETSGEVEAPGRVARPAAAARVNPALAPKTAAAPPLRSPVASSPAAFPAAAGRPPAAKSAPGATGAANASANSAEAHAGVRRPPPPVVPALKKVRGQIVKRRER
jgi:cytoskeletal protein CcmA (bactofilin family)